MKDFRLYPGKFKTLLLILLTTSVLAFLYRYIFGFYRGLDKIGSTAYDSISKQEYLIFIEIQDKTLYLLRDGVCIREYPIASGRGGLPSPIGCWKVVEKGKWGESFRGWWLGLNVPWGRSRLDYSPGRTILLVGLLF